MKTQAMTARPMKVPAASRGGAVKIIVIVLAVLFFLALLVGGALFYVGWKVTHSLKNGEISIPTGDSGSFSANTKHTYSADELGIEPYPGATSVQGGFSMNGPKGSMLTGILLTSDTADKVVDFYKGKAAGSELSSMEINDSTLLTIKKSNKETVTITVKPNDSSHNGQTAITILHAKDKQ